MTERKTTHPPPVANEPKRSGPVAPGAPEPARPAEHGGPRGLEPTRYGDWERNGKCVDF